MPLGRFWYRIADDEYKSHRLRPAGHPISHQRFHPPNRSHYADLSIWLQLPILSCERPALTPAALPARPRSGERLFDHASLTRRIHSGPRESTPIKNGLDELPCPGRRLDGESRKSFESGFKIKFQDYDGFRGCRLILPLFRSLNRGLC